MRTTLKITDIAEGLKVKHPAHPGQVFTLQNVRCYYVGISPTKGGMLFDGNDKQVGNSRYNLARLSREGYKLAQAVACLLLLFIASSCASTRSATRDTYKAETESSSKAKTSTSAVASTTANDTARTTSSSTTATVAQSDALATNEAEEVATTVNTYDAQGRLASSTTRTRSRGTVATKATATSQASTQGESTTAEQFAGHSQLEAVTTTDTQSHEKGKGKSSHTVTTGHPWYYWPVRGGIALVVVALLIWAWPLVAQFLGWCWQWIIVLLARRRRDKGQK